MLAACNRATCSVLLAISVALFFCPSHGWAQAQYETEYFVVPAFSTSENDGQSGGLIFPFLITDPDGELRSLVAPMFVQNSIVGASGSINVYAYGRRGQQLRFIGAYREEIERKLSLTYSDPAFGYGRFSLSFGAEFFKNATKRFFGFTQDSDDDDETNYTGREIRANWKLGLWLNEVTLASLSQRYRDVEVQPGADDVDEPFTLDVFPGVPGGDRTRVLGNRFTFNYDTRNSLVTPTDGTRVMGYAELIHNFNNDANPVFFKYEVEALKLFPSPSKRVVFVVRGDLQLAFGDEIPFYERSSLGGQNNLRGYGEDRFIDKKLLVFNVEQRIHAFRTRFLNVIADFEVAPFLDTGRVFNTFDDMQLFEDFELTPGVGFRGLVRPNLVGRVDYGYSDEGGAVYAGLDYPF